MSCCAVCVACRQAIKPDGVQRQVVGEVISRFEKKGYKLVAMKVSLASSGPPHTRYVTGNQPPARHLVLVFLLSMVDSFLCWVDINDTLIQ